MEEYLWNRWSSGNRRVEEEQEEEVKKKKVCELSTDKMGEEREAANDSHDIDLTVETRVRCCRRCYPSRLDKVMMSSQTQESLSEENLRIYKLTFHTSEEI